MAVSRNETNGYNCAWNVIKMHWQLLGVVCVIYKDCMCELSYLKHEEDKYLNVAFSGGNGS